MTPRPASGRSLGAAAVAVAILSAAALATAMGADAGRTRLDAASLAESALARSLSAHDDAPAREALGRIREHLRMTPLDAATRIIGASLTVEIAPDAEGREAAARQTLSAARLAATDEWIAHGAARVLARCGQPEPALREIRSVFAYAPEVAAQALSEVEPFVDPGAIDHGIPETPSAWLAWSVRLRAMGREAEADAWLAALRSRWPGDLDGLRADAALAAARDRIDVLSRVVPPTAEIAPTRENASLLAYRARTKAAAGDAPGARADAERAIELSRHDPWIETLAGDAMVSVDPAFARRCWSRALYRLEGSAETRPAARWNRSRLARLDEAEGRAGDALRGWRAILAEYPDDADAKRRIAELTGAPQ